MANTKTNKELLVTIGATQQEQLARCQTCRELVDKHEAAINGNGSMGLKTKIGIVFWVLTVVLAPITVIVVGATIKYAFGI
jgi:hypothetical protein